MGKLSNMMEDVLVFGLDRDGYIYIYHDRIVNYTRQVAVIPINHPSFKKSDGSFLPRNQIVLAPTML